MAQIGRFDLHFAKQGLKLPHGPTLHRQPLMGGLLSQLRTQTLIEGTEQGQSDGPQDISHQPHRVVDLAPTRWAYPRQGSGQLGIGVVDCITVFWVHGNVLQVTAAKAAIVLVYNDVAINQAERKVPTKDR
jgi:hypothetical protein